MTTSGVGISQNDHSQFSTGWKEEKETKRFVRGICVCFAKFGGNQRCWMENGHLHWDLRRVKYLTYTKCNSDNSMFDVCFSLARFILFDPLALNESHTFSVCTDDTHTNSLGKWNVNRERTFGGIVTVLCVSERFFFSFSVYLAIVCLFVLLVSLKMCYKNSNH